MQLNDVLRIANWWFCGTPGESAVIMIALLLDTKTSTIVTAAVLSICIHYADLHNSHHIPGVIPIIIKHDDLTYTKSTLSLPRDFQAAFPLVSLGVRQRVVPRRRCVRVACARAQPGISPLTHSRRFSQCVQVLLSHAAQPPPPRHIVAVLDQHGT